MRRKKMRLELKNEKPPIYFVPTNILCICGQKVLVNEPLPSMRVVVMCTNPFCSQTNLEKRIDLTKFAFTEYELL